jgi:aerobic-type carbon monoxide dehydrogenase small subunit (CoxS/CutS family)
MTEQSENGLAKPAREAGDVMTFTIIVNGAERTAASTEGRSLLEVLRDDLGVTGPKFGCGEGACGACTVLIDAGLADGDRRAAQPGRASR